MKNLSRNEMKKVMGGLVPPAPTCNASCSAWVNGQGNTAGTCSSSTVTINGHAFTSCSCSLSGGTSCNPS